MSINTSLSKNMDPPHVLDILQLQIIYSVNYEAIRLKFGKSIYRVSVNIIDQEILGKVSFFTKNRSAKNGT